MKKLRFMLIVLMVIVATVLVSCKKDDIVTPDEGKVEPAKVTVDYYEDDKDNVNEFIDTRYKDSEYLTKLEIKSDQDIKNIKLIEVEMGDMTNEKRNFFIKNVIYTQDELKANEVFVFGTVFPNFMPNLVLCYSDATDETSVYSITMSGKDNSIVTAPALLTSLIDMQYLTEDITYDKEHAIQITDPKFTDSEYLVNLVIRSDTTIKDFKIFDATVDGEKDEMMVFKKNEAVYEVDQLTPKDTLIYATEFTGDVPNRVITFRDVMGNEKAYAISMSGKDGSLVSTLVQVK